MHSGKERRIIKEPSDLWETGRTRERTYLDDSFGQCHRLFKGCRGVMRRWFGKVPERLSGLVDDSSVVVNPNKNRELRQLTPDVAT